MAQTEFHDILSVDKEKLISVITRYEEYPQFVEGCKAVKVSPLSEGKIRVEYQVNVMSQNVTYTLDHWEDRQSGKVEWELVDSNFFKKNNGWWIVKSLGNGKSDVMYALDVEFKVPVPGFILNRLVKSSLPGMVKSFEKQASRSK